jgi:vanillate O-demethylase ferredoxin subunit
MSIMQLRISDKTKVTDDIYEVSFVSANGEKLPQNSAGASITIALPEPIGSRSYSLINVFPEDTAPEKLTVAVKLNKAHKSGSHYIHNALKKGQTVSGIINSSAFLPVIGAKKHVFIAGGIGITPILSVLRDFSDKNPPELIKCDGIFIGKGDLPYMGEISKLCQGSFQEFDTRRDGRPEFHALIRDYTCRYGDDVFFYACGPKAMTDALGEAIRAAGLPDMHLISEEFSPQLEGFGGFTAEYQTLSGERHRRDIPKGARITQSFGPQIMPQSCNFGHCGACSAVFEGAVNAQGQAITEIDGVKEKGLCRPCSLTAPQGSTVRFSHPGAGKSLKK